MNYYSNQNPSQYRAFAGPFLPFVGGLLVGGLFSPKGSGTNFVPSSPQYPPYPQPMPGPAPMPVVYPPTIVGPVYGPYPYPVPTPSQPSPQSDYDQNIFLLNDPTFISANPGPR